MKKIIFSHESDIDGIGCIILAKLAFEDIDYVLLKDVRNLEATFEEYINKKLFDIYDEIYITDLSLYDPALTMVLNSELKNKIHIFDHHESALKLGLDRYDFANIISEDINGKRCGTDLFYEYLYQNNLLQKTSVLDEFVYLTLLEDVWLWKNKGNIGAKAHDLAIFFNIVGIEKYIDIILTKIKSNNLYFTSDELKLIEQRKEKYNSVIKNLALQIKCFHDYNNNKFGAVFADYEYRNDLAEYIRNNNPNDISYLMIIVLDKKPYGQKSLRAIKDNIDVNKVATYYGGGGHKKAAGINITKYQHEKAMSLSKDKAMEYLINAKYE